MTSLPRTRLAFVVAFVCFAMAIYLPMGRHVSSATLLSAYASTDCPQGIYAQEVYDENKVEHSRYSLCTPDDKRAIVSTDESAFLIVDMGPESPIITGTGWDLLLYEWPNPKANNDILLDWVVVEVAPDSGNGQPAEYVTVFVWGDDNVENNGSLRDYQEYNNEDPEHRIKRKDLIDDRAIGIDIGGDDGLEYRFVRVSSYQGDPQALAEIDDPEPEIDAIARVFGATTPITPTPTEDAAVTSVPTTTEEPTTAYPVPIGTPTEAPVATTAAPVPTAASTEAPVATTADPVPTTASTEAPVATTAAPVATTAPTQAPVATTAAPVPTTAPTQVPATTAPVLTTAPTQASVATTAAPVPTVAPSQAPGATAVPIATSAPSESPTSTLVRMEGSTVCSMIANDLPLEVLFRAESYTIVEGGTEGEIDMQFIGLSNKTITITFDLDKQYAKPDDYQIRSETFGTYLGNGETIAFSANKEKEKIFVKAVDDMWPDIGKKFVMRPAENYTLSKENCDISVEIYDKDIETIWLPGLGGFILAILTVHYDRIIHNKNNDGESSNHNSLGRQTKRTSRRKINDAVNSRQLSQNIEGSDTDSTYTMETHPEHVDRLPVAPPHSQAGLGEVQKLNSSGNESSLAQKEKASDTPSRPLTSNIPTSNSSNPDALLHDSNQVTGNSTNSSQASINDTLNQHSSPVSLPLSHMDPPVQGQEENQGGEVATDNVEQEQNSHNKEENQGGEVATDNVEQKQNSPKDVSTNGNLTASDTPAKPADKK